MARRHYSDRDRAAALAIYDSMEGAEHRASAAAAEAGVPRQTLQRWLSARDNAAPPDLRQETKEELADVFERVARKALAYVERFYDVATDAGPDGKYLQPSMTGAGIATDKAQLLRGKPTDRLAIEDWRRVAEEEGLDPNEVIAEANRILASGDSA